MRVISGSKRWQEGTGGELTWYRMGGSSAEELAALGKELGLHHLALEDVANIRQRPKVEDYSDHTFAIIRVPRRVDDLVWLQSGIFIGHNYIVTASTEPLPELDAVQQRLLAKGLPDKRLTTDHLLYLILDALIDAWFPYLDTLEDELDELEERVIDNADKANLAQIRSMKGIVSRTRKVSAPMREAMLSLERQEHPNIHKEARIYLRDVSDHMVRLTERLEHVKEVAFIAQESWNSSLANQQNQVMKRLTVVAGLLLLPGLLAGLGGMNFEGIPEWNYWAVTGTIIAMIVTGFSVAAWKKWL